MLPGELTSYFEVVLIYVITKVPKMSEDIVACPMTTNGYQALLDDVINAVHHPQRLI